MDIDVIVLVASLFGVVAFFEMLYRYRPTNDEGYEFDTVDVYAREQIAKVGTELAKLENKLDDTQGSAPTGKCEKNSHIWHELPYIISDDTKAFMCKNGCGSVLRQREGSNVRPNE